MALVRVPVANTVGKTVRINPDATVGATIGTDLRLPDGTTPTLTELAAALASEAVAAEQTRSFKQLIDSIADSQVPESTVVQHALAVAAAITIGDLSDVDMTSASADDLLFINGSEVVVPAAGKLTWTGTNLFIDGTTEFTGHLQLNNVIAVKGKIVAGALKSLAYVSGADVAIFGDPTIATNILGATVTVPVATVTAHEAALTILESQITDGTLLARVGSAETITAAWTFNAGKFLLQTGVSNPSHSEGLIYYDDTVHAVSYYNEEADVAVNLGQENLVRVRNASGSTITNGQLVYISGQVGNRPKVELAKADALATAQVLGMATHDIENNSDGYITTLGTVNLLNTSGDTEGAQIYLSETTAGDYTETAPTGASEFVIPLGFIMTANVATGRIYVSVAAALPHPAALSSFSGSTIFSASDGDLLYRDAGVWKKTAGALTWDGSILKTTGVVSIPVGTVGAPSLYFTGDLNTGAWSPGADKYAIAAGAVETIRYTEASNQILADHSMETGITASTTQTQGQRPLLSSYNEVSICANNDDVVTMPPANTGRRCLVINKGAKRLQLFPESGDDIGAGVDTSVTIKTNTSLLFVGIDGTTWHDVATRLESLQGVDLTDAADNDLLVRVAGIWEDTGGLLTWDGSLLDITGNLQVSGDVGFYGTSAVAQQTGVAVSAAGIHAALVNLGLITA